MRAGVNIELPEPDCYLHLVELVREGTLSKSRSSTISSRRCCYWKFQMGLFDDPYVDPDAGRRVVGCDAHRELALRAARETITLLKNDGDVLPLDLVEARDDRRHRSERASQSARRLQRRAEARRHRASRASASYVGDRAKVVYSEGCKITIGGSWSQDEVDAERSGRRPPADRRGGQGREGRRRHRARDRRQRADVARSVEPATTWAIARASTSIGRQNELVDAMVATGKPVVAAVFNGRPLSIMHLSETVPAILECWYLGQEIGTRRRRDVLFGDFNPGGKLPITIPRSVGHLAGVLQLQAVGAARLSVRRRDAAVRRSATA